MNVLNWLNQLFKYFFHCKSAQEFEKFEVFGQLLQQYIPSLSSSQSFQKLTVHDDLCWLNLIEKLVKSESNLAQNFIYLCMCSVNSVGLFGNMLELKLFWQMDDSILYGPTYNIWRIIIGRLQMNEQWFHWNQWSTSTAIVRNTGEVCMAYSRTISFLQLPQSITPSSCC